MTEYDLKLGDCLDWLPSIPTGSVDAVITDPPYGTTNLEWDECIDLKRWWSEIRRICKPPSTVIVFGAQPFTTDLINSNRKEFRYELIWAKTRGVGFLDANKRPLRAHENILLFSQKWRGPKNAKLATYNPQFTPGKPYKRASTAVRSGHYGTYRELARDNPTGQRHPLSWQLIANCNAHSKHPTQKPLDLVRWLVLSYTNPGDLVVDPFMGSGTTGVACVQLGRRFIGMEKGSHFYQVACNEIAAAQED